MARKGVLILAILFAMAAPSVAQTVAVAHLSGTVARVQLSDPLDKRGGVSDRSLDLVHQWSS